MQMHFKYFWNVFSFAFELSKWKVFAFAFEDFIKYFSNTFEIILKEFFLIYYLTRIGLNFGEYYSHCVLSYSKVYDHYI